MFEFLRLAEAETGHAMATRVKVICNQFDPQHLSVPRANGQAFPTGSQ